MAIVTLLRPPLLVPIWSDSGPLTPPIGPAYLAASLRQAGHEARIVDGLGENPFQVTPLFANKVMAIGLRSEEIVGRIDPDTDLIGVSCMFSQDWPEIRRLIQMVRRRFPGVPIIAGGEHITATAEFTLQSTPEVDVCVIGEGEETIVDLANALDGGAPFDAILVWCFGPLTAEWFLRARGHASASWTTFRGLRGIWCRSRTIWAMVWATA